MNERQSSIRGEGEQLLHLLNSARNGELNSEDTLFEQLHSYFAMLLTHELGVEVRRKVGHSDIVQESCARAVRGLMQFQGQTEGELRVWLRTLLTNEINQVLRGLHRQKRDVRRERPLDGDSMLGIHATQPTDPAVTPGTDAIGREQNEAVVAAMNRLPEHYRTVLELRLWQKLSHAEVAEHLGKSVAATEKLWYRAIQRMRRELET